MAVSTVFLFPGLGAYSTGVLRQSRSSYPQVDDVIAEIDQAGAQLGLPPVAEVLFGPRPVPMDELLARSAELYQLAIFGVSVAAHRCLTDRGAEPDLVVGHSFGEIAAVVAAGAFSVADGVRLVGARARALRAWEGWGDMAAVGTDHVAADHLLGLLDEPDLVVACHNAPRQVVLSGPVPAIERAGKVAGCLDLPFTRLHSPYASHHPTLGMAALEFVKLTAGLRQLPLRRRVFSPIHGRAYTDSDDLRHELADGLTRPVRFTESVRALHARGAAVFVEVGARGALTRCVDLTVPRVTTVAPLLDPEHEPAGLDRAVTACLGTDRGARPVTPSEDVDVPTTQPVTSGSGNGQADASPQHGPARAEVLRRLRELYADLLEYPPDVLTADAQLEAELGVDSLKQTALLTRVREQFGLPVPDEQVRTWQFPTLDAVADYVVAQLGQRVV